MDNNTTANKPATDAGVKVEPPKQEPAQPEPMDVEEKPADKKEEADEAFKSLAAPASEVIDSNVGAKAAESEKQEKPAASAEAQRALRKEDALKYLELVKTRFANNARIYNTFLDIMKEFKHDAITTPDVIARVTELFSGYPDLIEGFGTFLPAGYKMPGFAEPYAAASSGQPVAPEDYRQTVEFDHAITYVNKIKMRFLNEPDVYKQFLEILHRYQSDQESNRARPASIYDVYDQVAQLFSEHSDLLEEFTKFLPEPIAQRVPEMYVPRSRKTAAPRAAPAPAQPKKRAKSVMERPKKPKPTPKPEPIVAPQEYAFFETLKARVNNEAMFSDFIKCVHLYNIGVLSNIDTYVLVHDMLVMAEDVHESFRSIFNIPANFPYEFDASTFQMPAEEEKPAAAVPEAEDTLAVAGVVPVAAPTSAAEAKAQQSVLYDVFQSPNIQPPTGRALIVGADVDYNTCKRYGPSYRLMPKNHQFPRCSGRTELAKSVLNDILVSVPTGTEGEEGGYKSHKKNPYEEAIFKCEDERFELDMMVHINSSALRVLEPVVKKMHSEGEDLSNLSVGLQSHHYRLIERMYGDHGKEVVKELKKNPASVVEIVLKRLRQKDTEWRKLQKEWNNIWRETDRHNYYRALDVLSFHFKTRDRKALTSKAIVSELESLLAKEKKQAPRRSPPKFQVKSRMDDDNLLADIVELLNMSADKTLASRGDRDKALRFVAVFLNQLVKSSSDAPLVSDKDADDEYGVRKVVNKDVPVMSSRGRVMFVNTAIVVFARLFQILYDRMSEAKALCMSAQAKRECLLNAANGDASKLPLLDPHLPIVVQGPVMRPIVLDSDSGFPVEGVAPVKGMEVEKKPSLPVTPYPEPSPAPEMMDVEEEPKPFEEPTTEPKMMNAPPPFNQGNMPGPLFRAYIPPITVDVTQEEINDRYACSLEQVKAMIGTGHDVQRLEDKLRFLLGPNSYVLFGLDRLLQTIVRQALACASSDLSKKLIGLYVYHQSAQDQQPEYMYRNNVMKLIPDDESCFRLELSATVGMKDGKPKEMMRVLYVGIVDASAPSAVDPRSLEERWATYMSQYLMSDTVLIDPFVHHVFLKRSMKREAFAEPEMQQIKRPHTEDDIVSHNGLECKVCMTTYKIFYVEDTEDVLYRRSKLPSTKTPERTKTSAQRSSKFTNFIKKRIGDKVEAPWK